MPVICVGPAYDRHRIPPSAGLGARSAVPLVRSGRWRVVRADVLPTAARVAEILHPTLNLEDRIGRLAIRLTFGIPGPAVDLAREAGAELLRGDYCRWSMLELLTLTPFLGRMMLVCSLAWTKAIKSWRSCAMRLGRPLSAGLRWAAAARPVLEP